MIAQLLRFALRQRFITVLTATLGITAEHILPGYEDVWYYLWRERRLLIGCVVFLVEPKNVSFS